MKETIKTGDKVNTFLGYLEIKGYNGSLVYCDEYEFDGDCNFDFVGHRMLTLSEIADAMKFYDGKNHKVYFEERGDKQ